MRLAVHLLDGAEELDRAGPYEVLGAWAQRASAAGIDVALHLLARLDGQARVREVRRDVQYDPRPPV